MTVSVNFKNKNNIKLNVNNVKKVTLNIIRISYNMTNK